MTKRSARRCETNACARYPANQVAIPLWTVLTALVLIVIGAMPATAKSRVFLTDANFSVAQARDGAGSATELSKDKPELSNDLRNDGPVVRDISNPDQKAGVLVPAHEQERRQTWRGVLPRYGSYALFGVLFALAIFYLIRGRIKISRGHSGRTIERFTDIERIAHWLMAVSFIVLGLTGLNLIYGKEVLMALLGKDLFASMTALGKWLHSYIAFAFIAGLVMSFVFWLRDNIPNSTDVKWLAECGGMFSESSKPPARKFNAGQKILFWLIMLSGLSISLTGLALLFPFQFTMFGPAFALLNVFGSDLPTNLARVEEMQYATLWHGIVGLFMMCIVVGHIYLRSIGLEGAFNAMGSGQVDENWAREHHNLWVEEVLGPDPDAGPVNAAACGNAATKPGGGTPESAA